MTVPLPLQTTSNLQYSPMTRMSVALLLLLGAAGMTEAFKSGAPPSMCKDMMPHHSGSSVQSTPAPYSIVVEPPSGDDGVVHLTLSGPKPFTGVMIEGRTSLDGDSVGQFVNVPENYQTLKCNDIQNSAVTHSENSPKEKIQVSWEAPDGFDNEILFVATVVMNYTTYWTKISSPPTKVVKRSVGSSQASVTIDQKMYDGCGARKNCLGSPVGCETKKDCIALITVRKSGNDYEFEMMALKSKYIAFGLSLDDKMGGDTVVECAYENHREGFEGVNAYRSWNVPNQKANQRQESNSGITMREGTYNDGNTYCKVLVNPQTTVGDVSFDLQYNPYYLLLAAGKSTSEGKVGYHDVAREASPVSRLLADYSPIVIHDSFYDGCNVDRTCFGYPDQCVGDQSCTAAASILVQGTTYTFKLKTKEGAYIALGLSSDDKMGGDSVMECVQERNAVKLYMSWNKPGEKSNTREKVNQAGLKLVNSSFSDGVIYCEFTREESLQSMGMTFDLIRDKYFLLLAAGSKLKEKGVGYHDIFFTVSGQKRSLSDVSLLQSQSKLFVRLHGSFMVAAWIGTASIGIIFARYFKQTWVESSLCAKDLWFAWHRFFMLITWSLTVVATVLIFIDVGGWVSSSASTRHAIFGICTVVLCFVQPFAAAFRPHPTARNRPLFNWMHWLIGNAAHICAVVALFFATPVAKAELPLWLDWILFGYVALYVAIHLLFTIAGCISDSKGAKRVNTFPLKSLNTSRSAPNTVDQRMDAPFSGFRKLLLFVHIVGVTAVTAAIVVIVCLAPIDAQLSSLQKKIMSV